MKQFDSSDQISRQAAPDSKRRDGSGLIMAGVAIMLFLVVIPGSTPLLGQFTYSCSIGQSVSYSSPNMTVDYSFFSQSQPPGAGMLLTVLMVLFGVPGQQGPIAIPIVPISALPPGSINPPPASFPFPQIGDVGFLAMMWAGDEIICTDLDFVDTDGADPQSKEDAIRGLLESFGYSH